MDPLKEMRRSLDALAQAIDYQKELEQKGEQLKRQIMAAKGDAGVWNRRISETPIVIVDFETTGLTAGVDRIVEASAVRLGRVHTNDR